MVADRNLVWNAVFTFVSARTRVFQRIRQQPLNCSPCVYVGASTGTHMMLQISPHHQSHLLYLVAGKQGDTFFPVLEAGQKHECRKQRA